ncbi:MAG: AAA family ATPase [Spirochaetales bacterium]|nr:AAA family ATPase [Spirochaetales bacterium]
MAQSIALAGKGGTGKTTIAALLISRLCALGKGPILAVDADADANLGSLLGITPGKTLGDIREQALKDIKKLPAGMTKANYFELGLHEIIEESKGFDLITMGRAEGSGCYCYLNSLIRKFIDDLSPSYNWLVMDNEAGLEHLSRQTTRDIDALIVVITENPLSFQSATSISEILADMGSRIKKKYVVTNMIKHNNRKEEIIERLSDINLEYIGNIPIDEELDEIIFRGDSLLNLKDSPAINEISKILEIIGG